MVKIKLLLKNDCTSYLSGEPITLKSTCDLLIDEPKLEHLLLSGYQVEKVWTELLRDVPIDETLTKLGPNW